VPFVRSHGESETRQHGCDQDGERSAHRAAQRRPSRPRVEQTAFHALQCEDRQVGGNDDGDRLENRALDFVRRTVFSAGCEVLVGTGIRDVMAGTSWAGPGTTAECLRGVKLHRRSKNRTRRFTEREHQVLLRMRRPLKQRNCGAGRSFRKLRQSDASATVLQDWNSDAESIGPDCVGAVPGSALTQRSESAHP